MVTGHSSAWRERLAGLKHQVGRDVAHYAAAGSHWRGHGGHAQHTGRRASGGDHHPRRRRAQVQQAAADAGTDPAACAPDNGAWGFAALPPLDMLAAKQAAVQQASQLRAARAPQPATPAPTKPASAPSAATPSTPADAVTGCSSSPASAFMTALQADSSYWSPHAAVAMARAYGLEHLVHSCSGSLLGLPQPDASASQTLRRRIDAAWSVEALRRGVAAAKSGGLQGGAQAGLWCPASEQRLDASRLPACGAIGRRDSPGNTARVRARAACRRLCRGASLL
jgi:hypothetical protein